MLCFLILADAARLHVNVCTLEGLNTHIDVDDEFDPRGQRWRAQVCGRHVQCDDSLQSDVDTFTVQRAFALYQPSVFVDSEVGTVVTRRNAVLDLAVWRAWLIVISSLNKDSNMSFNHHLWSDRVIFFHYTFACNGNLRVIDRRSVKLCELVYLDGPC